MRKFKIAAAAALITFAAFAAAAAAMTPAIPEYEDYIFIANDGFSDLITTRARRGKCLT